jgi:hypothetical protein
MEAALECGVCTKETISNARVAIRLSAGMNGRN